MHAYLALALALAPALVGGARLGFEREIDPPLQFNYVLGDDYLAAQKLRPDVETKPRPDEPVVDNVVLESNVLHVRPARAHADLVRRRRGYNLENVRVPARYPYLPVANFNRFRRWG